MTSYITIRTFPGAGIADVLAFKTKRRAKRFVEVTAAFLAKAIERKQVRIEYVGRYALAAGCYFGREVPVIWKLREEREHGQEEGTPQAEA